MSVREGLKNYAGLDLSLTAAFEIGSPVGSFH